jgi:hypothetical protein
MTRTTPRRLITLHFSQIFLTLALTFIALSLSRAVARASHVLESCSRRSFQESSARPRIVPRAGSCEARRTSTFVPRRTMIPRRLASGDGPATITVPSAARTRNSRWGSSSRTVAVTASDGDAHMKKEKRKGPFQGPRAPENATGVPGRPPVRAKVKRMRFRSEPGAMGVARARLRPGGPADFVDFHHKTDENSLHS